MRLSFVSMAIVLGLLSAVGPFAIDMYLPALPTITADLQAATAATQMTLTAFFIAFGVCQLVYGPVSDMLGRKRPLYFGLVVFLLGSLGCTVAPSIDALVLLRIVQGIGAASVAVIPRAIIRDLHTGTQATRLMSLVMLVFSVSPILAPLTGSGLIVAAGWRAIFIVLAVASLVSLFLTAVVLPETRPAAERTVVSARDVVRSFAGLLVHRRFLGLTFIGGLGISSFFAFLASSSFVYIDHFHLTPTQYGLAFSINAVGFIGASQFSASLGERFGMSRVVGVSVGCYAAFALVLLATTAVGVDSLAVLMALIFPCFAFLGLVVPATMVLSLDDQGPIAGMAASLGGTLQMITGGVVMVIVSAFFDGTAAPMVGGIAACAVGAAILSFLVLSQPRLAAAE